jgi:hypothetical protein
LAAPKFNQKILKKIAPEMAATAEAPIIIYTGITRLVFLGSARGETLT